MPDWISFHASFRLTVKASILSAISHLRNIFIPSMLCPDFNWGLLHALGKPWQTTAAEMTHLTLFSFQPSPESMTTHSSPDGSDVPHIFSGTLERLVITGILRKGQLLYYHTWSRTATHKSPKPRLFQLRPKRTASSAPSWP